MHDKTYNEEKTRRLCGSTYIYVHVKSYREISLYNKTKYKRLTQLHVQITRELSPSLMFLVDYYLLI